MRANPINWYDIDGTPLLRGLKLSNWRILLVKMNVDGEYQRRLPMQTRFFADDPGKRRLFLRVIKEPISFRMQFCSYKKSVTAKTSNQVQVMPSSYLNETPL